MRVSGNEAWLDRDIWKNFIDYERNLNNSLTDKRMIVLCTYPLAKCDAHAVFDVSQVHEIAVTRRRGDWEIVEVPAIKKTKSQLAKIAQNTVANNNFFVGFILNIKAGPFFFFPCELLFRIEAESGV